MAIRRSDEKKFHLEGPDVYSLYYHDLRKEEHFLDRLQSRVGGVMVWGAVKINANDYNSILKTAFPFFKNVFGNLEWHFPEDIRPIQ